MRSVISGDLITVRAYQEEHIDALFAAVSESIAEVSRYETWCHSGYTLDEAADYVRWWRTAWAEETAFYFAVEEQGMGRFLGSCGLSGPLKAHRRAGLGYWIRSSFTGKGYATDAAHTVTRFGFDDLGLERIESEIAIGNHASLHITEKLGYRREGVLRHRLILPAGPTDTVMCALLREDARDR